MAAEALPAGKANTFPECVYSRLNKSLAFPGWKSLNVVNLAQMVSLRNNTVSGVQHWYLLLVCRASDGSNN